MNLECAFSKIFLLSGFYFRVALSEEEERLEREPGKMVDVLNWNDHIFYVKMVYHSHSDDLNVVKVWLKLHLHSKSQSVRYT